MPCASPRRILTLDLPEAHVALNRDECRASARLATFHFVLVRAHALRSPCECAPIRNLSTTGIGLLLSQPRQPAARLDVVLRHGSIRDRVATVVHSTPKVDNWLIGYTLEPQLSAEELQALAG
jgi:hypothetical protein